MDFLVLENHVDSDFLFAPTLYVQPFPACTAQTSSTQEDAGLVNCDGHERSDAH